MSTKIVQFGRDTAGVLTTLRGHGYQVYDAGTSIQNVNRTIRDHKPEALIVSECPDVAPLEVLSSAVSTLPSMARILFQQPPKLLDSSFFDLAIPISCPPLKWLPRLKNLIERSSVLRSEQAGLLSKSRLLRAESAKARSEAARARYQNVLEIERSRLQRKSFHRKWTNQRSLAMPRHAGWARTLIIEDHPAFRERLVDLLQDCVSTLVVAEAQDGVEGVRKAEELEPDLILLDIGLPGLNGFEVARRIRHRSRKVKIIFVSANRDSDFVTAAFDIGAEGYLLKDDVARSLERAINTVLLGGRYIRQLGMADGIASRL
jgi:CheY-like chemotaxis protein